NSVIKKFLHEGFRDFFVEIAIYSLMKPYTCLPKLRGIGLEKKEMILQQGTPFPIYFGTNNLTPIGVKNFTRKMFICLYTMSLYGIIHCDLKPENCVVLTRYPDSVIPAIIDWG